MGEFLIKSQVDELKGMQAAGDDVLIIDNNGRDAALLCRSLAKRGIGATINIDFDPPFLRNKRPPPTNAFIVDILDDEENPRGLALLGDLRNQYPDRKFWAYSGQEDWREEAERQGFPFFNRSNVSEIGDVADEIEKLRSVLITHLPVTQSTSEMLSSIFHNDTPVVLPTIEWLSGALNHQIGNYLGAISLECNRRQPSIERIREVVEYGYQAWGRLYDYPGLTDSALVPLDLVQSAKDSVATVLQLQDDWNDMVEIHSDERTIIAGVRESSYRTLVELVTYAGLKYSEPEKEATKLLVRIVKDNSSFSVSFDLNSPWIPIESHNSLLLTAAQDLAPTTNHAPEHVLPYYLAAIDGATFELLEGDNPVSSTIRVTYPRRVSSS